MIKIADKYQYNLIYFNGFDNETVVILFLI